MIDLTIDLNEIYLRLFQASKMSNANQAIQNASNLQKEFLARSVAAASMNAVKESDFQSNKSKKGKNSSRGSMSQNKSVSQQLQATARGRDDGTYSTSKSNNDGMKSAGYSR